jgi:hypothetical protein
MTTVNGKKFFTLQVYQQNKKITELLINRREREREREGERGREGGREREETVEILFLFKRRFYAAVIDKCFSGLFFVAVCKVDRSSRSEIIIERSTFRSIHSVRFGKVEDRSLKSGATVKFLSPGAYLEVPC